jgi:uncharacterized protein YodC (DUF2158 family)
MAIEAGDRVRHTSGGGPVVTVETIGLDGQATCSWFEGKTRKRIRRERFLTAALERIPKRPAGAIGWVF